MADRIQLVAIIAAGVLLLVVLEMVRRRRLMERYALLWMLSAIVLIGLASWRNGLLHVSRAVGIIYPPNALFLIALGFVLLLLLHFSAAVSRLSDQTKVLAQRLALLEERVAQAEKAAPDAEDDEPELEPASQRRRRFARVSSD
jgi:hypothetical protein